VNLEGKKGERRQRLSGEIFVEKSRICEGIEKKEKEF